MAPNDLVIAGRGVVMPDAVRRVDIGIRGGQIAALGAHRMLGQVGARLGTMGRVVLPSVVNTHVHCWI